MTGTLQGVVSSQNDDGTWQAYHEASGRKTEGANQSEAEAAMRELLGMATDGSFDEPLTSDLFEGLAQEIALYLEGPVSNMLALHSGFARLEAYQEGLATIRLGGGCQGCPSSRITLMNGVLRDLQDQFGEDVIVDAQPVLD
ncbi:MAG: NifU family protein [Oligoflexus sp.]